MAISVLIVDDEQSARDLCVEILHRMGFKTETAESGARALEVMEREPVDIVLTDVRMPGLDGIELLKILRQKYPETDVVMMTGFGTIQASVEAIKLGAYDYLTKPFKVDEFKHTFQRLVEKQELAEENRLLREQLKARQGYAGLVGSSAGMQKVFRLILMAASKRQPVLILGESGTGKELVARAIHAQSPWKDKPFVPVDCGALTPTLIESELFGHVRGAFTGASQARQGLLASARGGTVFLDEIAELPLELQGKLLRALQEHEVRPIGGNEWTRLDARIIAATNQDVLAAIKRGSVRKDLYFRLNVVSIKMPPLRERKNDIPFLVNDFIERHSGGENVITGISYDAMTRMINYSWPGNVRELENCIQRALVLGAGPLLQVKDLPSAVLFPSQVGDGEVLSLKDVERQAIMQALEATGGERQQAAKKLGIGKTTIYRKLKEFGLEDFPAPAKLA
ncbi:MAG: sigma-54-dependent transcriptional regulator [Terriglobia bacterium]